MSKTYRYVGVSSHRGKTAVRYANSAGRARHLERVGHEAVWFMDAGELLHPMDLVDLLLSRAEAGEFDAPATAAVHEEARRLGFLLAA